MPKTSRNRDLRAERAGTIKGVTAAAHPVRRTAGRPVLRGGVCVSPFLSTHLSPPPPLSPLFSPSPPRPSCVGEVKSRHRCVSVPELAPATAGPCRLVTPLPPAGCHSDGGQAAPAGAGPLRDCLEDRARPEVLREALWPSVWLGEFPAFPLPVVRGLVAGGWVGAGTGGQRLGQSWGPGGSARDRARGRGAAVATGTGRGVGGGGRCGRWGGWSEGLGGCAVQGGRWQWGGGAVGGLGALQGMDWPYGSCVAELLEPALGGGRGAGGGQCHGVGALGRAGELSWAHGGGRASREVGRGAARPGQGAPTT